MKDEFLLLIDGSSLLSTQFFGSLPKQILFAKTMEEKEGFFNKILQTGDGFYTNGVFGFVKYLFKILKEQKPSHIAVAWDLTRNTFRRELYAEYKGNRSETMAPLADQFAICEEVVSALGISQFMSNTYEADDFCGSLARKFEEEIPVFILTKDNDYLQLVNDKTKLWLMHSSAEKTDELYEKYGIDKKTINAPDRTFVYDTELIRKEFGVEAENVNSLKGIMGDASDNIKGVSGVGEATARALIGYYKTVDNLYKELNGKTKKELDEIKNRWKEELQIKRSPMNYLLKESDTELVGEKAARLSEELATIKRDIDLGALTLADLRVNLNKEKGLRVLSALEFKSIHLSDLEEFMFDGKISDYNEYSLEQAISKNDINEHGRHLIFKLREKAESIKITEEKMEPKQIFEVISVSDVETAMKWFSKLETVSDRVGFHIGEEGLCFAFQTKIVKISQEGFLTEELLKEEFHKILEKNEEAIFVTFSLKEQLSFLKKTYYKNIYDMAVAHYLLNPLATSHGAIDVKKDYEEVLEDGTETNTALSAYLSYPKLLEEMKKFKLLNLFKEIEMPLVTALFEMEERGVRIAKETLKEYGEELGRLILGYEKEIHEMAGEEFNINSPKQLGVILFEKLKLPHGKKTKSGYSTSADVLERLRLEDPIVEKVLQYRQVAKLKSTYTDGLEAYIQEDGRIHSKLNQLVTATGRLSSTEPNLQNIPIRTELGKKIRKCFVPKEGYVFIDADYSQIELRIMAHLSGDEELIKAYRGEKDIHRITASQVFKVDFDDVTEEQRRNAKAVNFGIIYGISSFGLGENLGISRKEAEGYIKDYFTAYPKVKEYLEGLVKKAKEEGYVETYFGRIRPVPELESHNFMQRQFGERIAMNSPVQGTAADIIKIAMVRINSRLKEEYPSSQLILQIHDELLIEAKEEEKEEIGRLVHEEMRKAASLSVPLESDVKFGYTWYDAH